MRNALTVLAVLACATLTARAADEKYKSKEGKFAIQFPDGAKVNTETKKAGEKLEMHVVTADAGEGKACVVLYIDIPGLETVGAKVFFDGAEKSAGKAKGDKFEDAKDFTFGKAKLPAREFVVVSENGKKLKTRMIVDGNLGLHDRARRRRTSATSKRTTRSSTPSKSRSNDGIEHSYQSPSTQEGRLSTPGVTSRHARRSARCRTAKRGLTRRRSRSRDFRVRPRVGPVKKPQRHAFLRRPGTSTCPHHATATPASTCPNHVSRTSSPYNGNEAFVSISARGSAISVPSRTWKRCFSSTKRARFSAVEDGVCQTVKPTRLQLASTASSGGSSAKTNVAGPTWNGFAKLAALPDRGERVIVHADHVGELLIHDWLQIEVERVTRDRGTLLDR